MKLLTFITLLAVGTGSATLAQPSTPVNICIDHKLLWRAAAEQLRDWAYQTDQDVEAICVDYLRDDEGVSLQNGISPGKYINMAVVR